ncbi:MAG TPA: ribosome-binding factor A [Oligoflexia bacterium]|nr:ribosome-binding factor A [Oligoflexia bacterium]
MASYRKQRVGDLLLAFLAEEVRNLRDPRLSLITLTGLDLSNDLKTARVHWALPPCSGECAPQTGSSPPENAESLGKNAEAKRRKDAEHALRGANGLLRRKIGEELELRYVPELNFRYDESSAAGNRIDYLLKKAGF